MKVLLHLVPRFGDEAAFRSRVHATGEALCRAFGTAQSSWNPMFRVADDPFGPRTLFRATVEWTDASLDVSAVAESLAAWKHGLADVVHVDLSMLLVGTEKVFFAADPAPIRMQYLMRARAGIDHAAYQRHYREVHSGFGAKTPGITGYAQFYVDPEATRRAGRGTGFGGFGVESVSQLHLESIEDFLAAVSQSTVGREAMADERSFVDRKSSLDFFSRVVWPEERANARA